MRLHAPVKPHGGECPWTLPPCFVLCTGRSAPVLVLLLLLILILVLVLLVLLLLILVLLILVLLILVLLIFCRTLRHLLPYLRYSFSLPENRRSIHPPVKNFRRQIKIRLTGGRSDGILLEKTKKAGCIRLTSSKGKEVNSEYGGGRKGRRLCCADAALHPCFLFSEGGASVISNVVHQLNEEIRDKEIRLIGETGEQLGIMSSADALHIADERGAGSGEDLSQATPPVCKLMNYGKYRFEQSKREKEARKNQHVVEIKEIRMSPGIDVGGFQHQTEKCPEVPDGGTG